MRQDEQLVFISYTANDRDRVEPIVDFLLSSGVDAWVDVRRLKAGQNWDFEIRKALDKAAIIVVFISNKSVTKRGYVQKEIRLALEKADEKLVDDIYVIPVLLDEDVTVPDQIKNLQFIRCESDSFQNNLIEAISHQLERLGLAMETAQSVSEIRWQFYNHRESRDGIPGYEADLRMIRLSSEKYPMIPQVSDIIRGDLLHLVSDLRYETLDQNTDMFNFGQDRYRRINTLDLYSNAPNINGRIISIMCSAHSYYAGAAHPNLEIKTYCFLIDPLCYISRLQTIFDDESSAFTLLQKEVRSQLSAPRIEDGEDCSLLPEAINSGTEVWDDFQAFLFDDKGIEFHFPPYQVASYAAGPQTAHVAYHKILPFISTLFKAALDIEYLPLQNEGDDSQGTDNWS